MSTGSIAGVKRGGTLTRRGDSLDFGEGSLKGMCGRAPRDVKQQGHPFPNGEKSSRSLLRACINSREVGLSWHSESLRGRTRQSHYQKGGEEKVVRRGGGGERGRTLKGSLGEICTMGFH